MSFDLVLFGGTGDLSWRKLMPALFQAFKHGTLPEGARIIGVGRDDLGDERYRALIMSRFDEVDLAKRPSPEEFERFSQLLEFVSMDLSKPEHYANLGDKLAQRQADTVVGSFVALSGSNEAAGDQHSLDMALFGGSDTVTLGNVSNMSWLDAPALGYWWSKTAVSAVFSGSIGSIS